MQTIKKTYRIEETLAANISAIAEEKKQSENQTVEMALKFYRDYCYLQDKACLIDEQILNIFQASLRILEDKINKKNNQLISELAIQSAIQNCILAESLEVQQKDLHRYRLKAVDFIKERNRIFRMDEANE